MARRLRLQFHGARYHVINRGNYRHDVFGTVGAARAFLTVLGEAGERYGWRLHAYVVMRNHYHLALETPLPNLVEGMHWLQSTFATRFNRFRAEHGHLFQGRYQALLIEDAAHLVRVIDYIHLNPVRAGIVPPAQAAAFRWSSLGTLRRGRRPVWLCADALLTMLGLADSADGWAGYAAHLAAKAGVADQAEAGELTRGWAIGTPAWQKSIALAHIDLATAADIPAAERLAFKEARWQSELLAGLQAMKKTAVDIADDAKGAPWKIGLARQLRRTVQAPNAWIAAALNMGCASSVRAYASQKI